MRTAPRTDCSASRLCGGSRSITAWRYSDGWLGGLMVRPGPIARVNEPGRPTPPGSTFSATLWTPGGHPLWISPPCNAPARPTVAGTRPSVRWRPAVLTHAPSGALDRILARRLRLGGPSDRLWFDHGP